jgi:hypothetical protein
LAIRTSNFDAQMCGIKFCKGRPVYKNRFPKYSVVASILDFLNHKYTLILL